MHAKSSLDERHQPKRATHKATDWRMKHFVLSRGVVGSFVNLRCKLSTIQPLFGMFVCACFAHLVPQQAVAQMSAPSPNSTFSDCAVCPEMVVIPSGSFMMGSSPEEANRDIEAAPKSYESWAREAISQEQPLRKVIIGSPFALAKFPVTKGEFAAFVQDTGYSPALGCIFYSLRYRTSPQADWRMPGFVQTDREPVVCVNWQDAKAYVSWLNKKVASLESDGPYRLPSEAEWEYAARAGTRTARWWGDSIGRNNTICARCGSNLDQKRTGPVGQFQPNPFGLYDVLGNVTQWTEDCWNENYNGAPSDGAGRVSGNCEKRIARGGDWSGFPWVVRSAMRFGLTAEKRANLTGFRVAKTLQGALP